MPNDITVTKNETPGSERWDVEYTADRAATVAKTMETAGTMLDRDIKVAVTIPSGSVTAPSTITGSTASGEVGTVRRASPLPLMEITQDISITTDVTTPGYISSGTPGVATVKAYAPLTGTILSSITPTTTDIPIASDGVGFYLIAPTAKVVGDADLIAGNIKKDVSIFGVTGTYEGSGGSVQRGVLRPDAELVGKWTMDQYVVADLGLTIPSYTTTTTTFRLSQNIDTYVGDPLTYRYFITARALTTPEYSITTLAKGRQEYSMGFAQYEWLYNSSGQMQSLDGSKSYGAYSLIQGYASTREIYWSSATGIGVYTSDAYCARQGLAAPTIASNKTITIKSPSIAIRGDANYLTQTFFDAMTDIRCQYVIELWRVPLTGVDGWAHGTQMDSIFNDINNNGGTLT